MFERCLLSIGFGVFVCLAALVSAVPQGLEGDEPSDAESGALRLESETAKYSAQIYCNENATDAEKEEDKKRENIGIGEVVTIKTVGKEALIQPESEIEWTIVKGLDILDSVPRRTGVRELKLILSKESMKSQTLEGIEVTAFTKKVKLVGPKKLTIVFPEALKGEHIPNSENGKGQPVEDCPRDGEPTPSASAKLDVSILPKTVNFSREPV